MPKRLLVVDDSPQLTRTVARVAEPLGFAIRTCNDPQHALDAFVEFRPDILMLDMHMPETDGIDVLHDILLTGIPTRIVVTSGHGDGLLQMAMDMARLQARLDVVSVRKPFRRQELSDVLKQLAS